MSTPVDVAGLWAQVSRAMRARIGEPNFVNWIAPLRPRWADGRLVLEAPHRTVLDAVARHFLRALRAAVSEALARAASIDLRLAGEVPPPPLRLRPPGIGNTFATLVVGETNARACAAALGVAGGAATRPLFIHGPSGVGKTHLLHAIFHERQAAAAPAAYVSAAELVDALLAACEAGDEARFWDGLAPLGALLVDDAHSIAGREEIRERLLEGLAAWAGMGRILVLVSDRAPGEIPALVGRLRARLADSVVAAIEPPDPALRLAILAHHARRLGIGLGGALAARLAAACGGSVRRLQGTLTRLAAHARLQGRTIDERLAAEVVPELRADSPAALTVERILAETARSFGLSGRQVHGRQRTHDVVLARQVAMYLARELLRLPYAELGVGFDRDHTTVLNAWRSVSARRERDPAFAATVARIEERLGQAAEAR